MSKAGENMKRDLQTVQNNILKGLIDVAEVMALNAKALIVRKLDTTGIPGETYSTHELPLFFLTGNAKTAYGKEAIENLDDERRKNGLPGVSYEDLRRVENLPVDHVYLSFSGEMLRATGIVSVRQVGNRFIAVLGGTTPASKDKLAWNRDRYGDIFKRVLGEEGRLLLKQVAEEETAKVAKKL